jgi:hypothetical protein
MPAPAFAQNATARARERLDEQDEKVRFEWCAWERLPVGRLVQW